MASALLILLGAAVPLPADLLPDPKIPLLPPVNFTVGVAGLAQVLLRWEANPAQELGSATLGYQVKIHAPEEVDYETRDTQSRRVITLHQGVSASVRTILWDGGPGLPASPWVSAALDAPPGSPGTSVLNLTCTTHTWASEDPPRPYLVSLHCSWLPGEAAPEDGQYFLYYRYGARTEACHEYSVDALGRHVACRVPSTFISSKSLERLAVRVNGSSRRVAVRPLDQLFALPAIDRVNPPGNVTATAEGSRLSIRWEKPVSAFPMHCFDYEVRIHNERKGYLQTEKMKNNTFIGITDGASRHAIRVRAAVSARCRPHGSWGEWSQTVYAVGSGVREVSAELRPESTSSSVHAALNSVLNPQTFALPLGTDEWRPWTGWLLTVLMATACLVLLLLSLACRLCHLWPRLFPPVPTPKNTIKDFFVALEYEKAGSSEVGIEVINHVQEPGFEAQEETVL